MHFAINWKKLWQVPGILKATSLRKREMEYMGAAYMAEGLVTLAGSRLYTNATYTAQDIAEALLRFENVFQNVEVKAEAR
jgi:glutamate-1-semialdehyde 2,1-aminomutase